MTMCDFVSRHPESTMELDDQYPAAEAGFRTPSGFYKANSRLECFHCGKPSSWFHLGNLLFFCSDDCYRRYVGGEKYRARQTAG
jgi:hypothetical protein